MESFSLICDVCGTVNRLEATHCLACGQVLGASNRSSVLASAPTVSARSSRLLKQRYRVLHVIGKGGMGTVYIGVDTQLGDRLVAIKEMTQGGLTPPEKVVAAKNFEREAHLLASLQHPHLPGIYDHFSEGSRWYLVMSFIKGQTLPDYLEMQGGYLDVEEVVEIGLALCSVLQYLHTHRPPIIFRDLKPSNIMRTVDGNIYLIDFGIARIFKPGQGADTAYQGSAGYAPPEQYGTSQTTPRSDIYSLGATLYYLLTGYNPASTPFNLPPLDALAADVPPPLTELITAMLALDDEERPQSAEAVKWELQNIAEDFTHKGQIPPVTNAPSTFRPRKTRKKRKKGIIAILALVAALIVAGALYLFLTIFNGNDAAASSRVVSTFCDAINSETPDFASAYQQLSISYQRAHSLSAFQASLRGASRCMVMSFPDVNLQAEVGITMPCIIPPGAPTPPAGASPPLASDPVYLTLVKDSGNNWKINVMYISPQYCGPPRRASG